MRVRSLLVIVWSTEMENGICGVAFMEVTRGDWNEANQIKPFRMSIMKAYLAEDSHPFYEKLIGAFEYARGIQKELEKNGSVADGRLMRSNRIHPPSERVRRSIRKDTIVQGGNLI